jgi:uncharacterized membrane protein (UPF0182 family)
MTSSSNNSAKNSKKRRRPARTAAIVVIVLAVIAINSAGFYTNALWFGQLGFGKVFATQVASESTMFSVGALAMGLIVWVNFKLASKSRPLYAPTSSANDPLAQFRDAMNKARRALGILVPLVLAIFAGIAVAPNWQTAVLWLNHTYTGVKDPQFGMDTGFYLFDLPFWNSVVGFLSTAVVISGVIAAVIHLLEGNIKLIGRNSKIAKPARIQLGVNIAIFLVLQAASLWLSQYSTVTNPAGLFTGATYTDVMATIPGLEILAMISILVAALFIFSAITGKWRASLTAVGLMVVSSIVLSGIYPWAVQNFQVVPNERTLESKFIQRNIEATRAAYGVDKVKVIPYAAKTTVSSKAVEAAAQSTANIRLIDPSLVSASFKQLEQYKQYYGFENLLDVDRYKINGKVQDTVLAVRELNQSGLGGSQSWYNNTIVYTHGYGLVAAYGNQRTADGQPVFAQSGIPSQGVLGKFEPRIYFGENSPEYSIVGAKKGSASLEMDYPGGTGTSGQTYTTFNGNGGPKLDNFLTKLAYAIKFQSEQILLSDAITADSQVLYNRDPAQRVAAVAPYLTLDSDPYPAIVDGRVVWIVDGYTTSNQYPYSRAENMDSAIRDSQNTYPSGRGTINYIRNSVKATVDAYDGSVHLYAWDTKDPILESWMKVFPNTVEPVSHMSGALLSHVRYPEDLFKVQRGILGQYHVQEAGSFYSQQDAWMTPNDPVDASASFKQPPYYLSLSAPGQTAPAFSLYTTFIPRSTGESTRNVLTGYLVADADAGTVKGKVSPNYGVLRMLELPRTSIVPGPGQVQNNFNVDPEVSRLLNLLRQGSTTVLNGNLLTLPVAGGLLYVQPVYIQSTGETSFPLVKKVLVAFGDKIAFEDTLDAALNSLFGTSATGGGSTGGGSTGGGTSTGGKVTSNPALADALARANQAIQDAATALKAGDWAAYGDAEKALKQAVADAVAAQK